MFSDAQCSVLRPTRPTGKQGAPAGLAGDEQRPVPPPPRLGGRPLFPGRDAAAPTPRQRNNRNTLPAKHP